MEDDVEGYEADPTKEAIYLEAKTKMQRGSGYNTARFYKEAIELFTQIEDYKNSKTYIEQCKQAIERLSK